MLPNPYEIKSEKQSNGVWGSPYELKYMDTYYPYKDDSKFLLISSIITAVAEYTKRPFEIHLTHEKGFVIIFRDNLDPQIFFVVLDKYKLEENKLELIK
jgi:hypothetical protein